MNTRKGPVFTSVDNLAVSSRLKRDCVFSDIFGKLRQNERFIFILKIFLLGGAAAKQV